MGIKAPIIRQGDDLKQIVIASVMNVLQENGMKIQDGDVIGITESVVARAHGNYVAMIKSRYLWQEPVLVFAAGLRIRHDNRTPRQVVLLVARQTYSSPP